MNLAPLTLFVYNRLWHTRQTIEALQQNELAAESNLFIYSDGPKNAGHAGAVDEVRDYIRAIGGFKSVTITEREENWGLARSIISGVTEIVKDFDRIIVVEDDLVTSPFFLRYMNDALEMYKSEESVISVHGYINPLKGQLPETFFLKYTGCWGWGTWKRGWALFESDGEKLLKNLKDRGLVERFDLERSYPFTGMLNDQVDGKNDSWAIRWQASAFLNDKLTLFPGRSLVNNIGHDDSGIHCGKTDRYDVALACKPINVSQIPLKEDLAVRSNLGEFFKRCRQGHILDRIIGLLRHLIKSSNLMR